MSLSSCRKGSAKRAKCKKKTIFSFCIPEMPPTLAEGKLQKQAYADLHVSCLTRQVLRHKSAIYGIFLSQNHCFNGCLEKKNCNDLCKFAIRLQICIDFLLQFQIIAVTLWPHIHFISSMEYISRDIENIIIEMARYFQVVVVTGPRQSGKTTLIQHLFAHYACFSLEDLNVRELASSDPVAFLRQNEQGMIIDEVQRVPELMSYIQGIVDREPDKRFVLSGSSNFAMLRSVSQSLAGRAAVLELLPLSMNEVSSQLQSKSLDQLMFDGLYPAVCAGKNLAQYVYPAYAKTYLERDVRDLLHVTDMMAFERFLRLCAARIGSLFVASQLANEVGVAVNTVKSWLSVLQASYVITMLPPYYENTTKRLIKTPKLYFCDTGLACYLLDIESPQQLARDKMRGALFENLIVMEAIKSRLNVGKQPNAYFYRDSNQNEIDLILKRGEALTGIEIKSSMTYHKDFERTVRSMDNYVKSAIAERAVVYAGELENTVGKVKLLNYSHLQTIL